jgi:ABC-type sugar transport system permease subunit
VQIAFGRSGVARKAVRRGSLRRRLRKHAVHYAFLLPALAIFVVFKYYPIALALVLSFQKLTLQGGDWVGLANFARAAQDTEARHALGVTFLAMIESIVVGIPFAFGLALLLSQELRFKTFFRTAFFIPFITPVIATTYVWKLMFSSDFGVIAGIMRALFGRAPAFLADTRIALYVIVAYGIWKGIGYTMLIYLAAMDGVDTTLYDAARIDGASFSQYLFRVLIPLLSPITWMLGILGVIGGLKSFTSALLLTGGGPKDATMFFGLYIYYQAFRNFQFGYAAALGLILLLIIVAITLLNIRRLRESF